MGKYHKIHLNKYPNIFGCHIIYRMNIQIYLDTTSAAVPWREGEGEGGRGEEGEEGGVEGEGAGRAPAGLDKALRNKSKQDTSKMQPHILAEPKTFFSH